MAPLTIAESFDHKLPDLALGPHDNPRCGDSGNTTKNTIPPKIWVTVPADSWSDATNEPLGRHRSALITSQVAATEVPFEMPVEADVSRATVLYLTHPINKALENIFGGKVRFAAELSNTVGSATLRMDLTWFYYPIPGVKKVIAILELKKRGMLVYEHWSDAYATSKTMDKKLNEDKDTFFVDNAEKMMKQISAYVLRHKTKYAALFDWETLFLGYFAEADFNRENIGDWVAGTYIGGDSSARPFRKVVLGWLLCACAAAGLGGSDNTLSNARNSPQVIISGTSKR
ncbi:hypothetical protein EJ05DRAFT_472222 [Pseudovirgaria hyperparasitica]|uniref:Uncharacterized protein n=1 Tax=Pseudovirgaria hyperparasitica TaxID=470096 RepID=A0A6A6WM76_9PEZI|nr:uncharacterized protein EJ05DRAFT_472222 [Pseudovirgaria hyperparasitica]KAF2763305.1 hypothetical protein EJ05DRAFT_472222 [Pseudovirgaria hyperparasitica]